MQENYPPTPEKLTLERGTAESITDDEESEAFDTLIIRLEGEVGKVRIDRLLADHCPDLSRARLQALMQEGHILFDGLYPITAKSPAKQGAYHVFIPAPLADKPEPQDLDLEVLFEDEHLIVVNKPAGMAAHPAAGTPDKTLVNALLYHCKESLSGICGVLRPGIVHRLDKETSGVMVAAKTDKAHQGLSLLFSTHSLTRRYIGLVRGTPKPSKGTVDTLIGRSSYDRKKMAVLKSGGRQAITHYRTLETFGGLASLIEATLETGRTHQIRVHMAHIGCACLGDPTYGSGAPSKKITHLIEEYHINRQMLHAQHLGFIHPITQVMMSFDTAPPLDFSALLGALSSIESK